MCNLIQFWLDLINSLQLMSIISLVTLAFGLYSFWSAGFDIMHWYAKLKTYFIQKHLGKLLFSCYAQEFLLGKKNTNIIGLFRIYYTIWGKNFIFWQFSYLKHNVKYPKTHVNDITHRTEMNPTFEPIQNGTRLS